MRSKELAQLAGVSVRTLRHYHQIGILPEPRRESNGYRSYDLASVARLLRIRRLAELGIGLDRMPTLLDDPDDDATTDVLDELDAELAETVERLQALRRRIADLRADGVRPDLPPGVVDLIAFMRRSGARPQEGRGDGGPAAQRQGLDVLDLDALVVLTQAARDDDERRELLDRLREGSARGADDERLVTAEARLSARAPEAGAAEVASVAEELAEAMGRWL